MKKTLIIGLVTILSLVLTYGFADAAAVTGVCSNCHVMHASEGGTAAASQYNYLARNTCIGCHTGATYEALGVRLDNDGAAANLTAAGTFNTAVATAANMRHDVAGFSGHTAVTAAVGKYGLTTAFAGDLTCAGNKGCHGIHASTTIGDAGISGYHHGSKTGYRFLHIGTAAYAAGTAVVGGSALTREKGTLGATAANHNVYSASTTIGISKFCANCHGEFHSTAKTGAATPFTRHPTDNLFSAATGWTLTTVVTDYNANPFAFTDYATVTIGQAYTASTAQASVACVSCHRAHGGANASTLRYSYAAMNAGNATNNGGCENCHHKQR